MKGLSVQEWSERKSNLFAKYVRLGLANIGGLYGHEPPTLEAAIAVVARALGLMIKKFDTASLYGYGLSEQMFGDCRASQELRERLRAELIDVSTKVIRNIGLRHRTLDSTQPAFWYLPEPYNSAVETWGITPAEVGVQLFDSLLRMRLPSVTGVALHDIHDAITETAGTQSPISYDDMGPVVRFLLAQKELGRLKEIGFAEKFDEPLLVLGPRFRNAGIKIDYFESTALTLTRHRTAVEKTMPYCLEHGISLRVAGPFDSRALVRDPRKGKKVLGRNGKEAYYYDPDTMLDVITTNYVNVTDEEYQRLCLIWQLAEDHGEKSPSAAAVQFCLAQPAVSELVIGASSPKRFEQLEADVNHLVPGGLWDAYREAGIIHPDAAIPSVAG